jgi:hypothetical protein
MRGALGRTFEISTPQRGGTQLEWRIPIRD